ncbi:transglutaminase-like domain-containing protein [Anaerobium acetethylicum]|uniref:Transglutaminase-like domain-containing protein n=1 Tax=Anaerobium acetethylicum TaxID=1619234 RepID=A0A1D3TVX0_9FIRM|nr:transglutaminase-like domain-containing protein [Anaerobium acetethylicum]SCP98307.1 Transglutaminase-like domain-containing protein [Anaerobium acetethylicum]
MKFLESDLKHNDYKQINEQITKEKEKVVSLVKRGMTEKETVELFEDWIIQNMEYNYKVLEKNDSGLETSQAIGNIQNTSSACILNREGICGGLSDLLVDLCNEVGIEAYSVKGMLSMNQGAAGLHQWVAVKINQMIFYIDPTRDVSLKTRNTFYTKEQFYSREGVKYEPLAYYDY